MGTTCSKPQEKFDSVQEGEEAINSAKDVKLEGDLNMSDRSRAPTQVRFSTTVFQGRNSMDNEPEMSQADLQAQLEKLDEERHTLQEQLTRLQAIELTQDGGDSLMGDDGHNGPRVRFSRAEGDKESSAPTKSMKPPADRRNSFAGGASRISTYVQAEHRNEKNVDTNASLMEMLTRSRRRTRFNHRSSEGRTNNANEQSTLTYLPRGGVHVQTKYGAIQFGIPPETVKDSIRLGLELPRTYVVPKDRFNLKYGTNTSEVEFPAYMNFFVKGRSTTLVCTDEAAEIIKKVMDEVLEGPDETLIYTDEEYSAFVDDETFEARPNHIKEINYFKEPRNGRIISTATLVNFAIFVFNEKKQLSVNLPGGDDCEEGSFLIVDEGNQYAVVVDGEIVARVDDHLASAIEDPPHILMPSRSELMATEEFDTPDFGITVLGSADGFTADGTTAGFVLWMRNHGILVDPPAHSAQYLRQNGISSRKVTHVILTHCHADHDAGTFQKILLEQRVTVMTTKTIMASFIRKYSLVSGMPEDFLLRLFIVHFVKISEPVHFQGGTITFFYALHALPCIGFRAELDGKSITYSGDTFYEPEGLQMLQERGIISEARRQSLIHRGSLQPSDLILHEAGVAPIHTPPDALKALPQELRDNLKVIHISDKRADDAGLEKVRVGFEHTVSIPVQPSAHAQATNILHMLLATDLFRSLDVNTAIDLLLVTTQKTYTPGELIFRPGDPGDCLRIVQAGSVTLERDGTTRELRYCDYFGEGALLADGGKHSGTATALTMVRLVEIAKPDFQYLMSRRPLLRERLMRRAQRYAASWKAIGANSVFANFSLSQVMQLQSVMQEETVKVGQVVWKKGELVKDVILVGQGIFYFKELPETEKEPFRMGALLVDVYSLEHRKPHRLTMVAQTDGRLFRISGRDILEFLDNNPGAFIWMRDTLLVE
ncbi:hypothetical protein AB1Y20_019843 [Prymnesium parvum]|uniref:Cyclic nucleotide-binding domain-containing protein n=1 Tax=Prymnesium parvum TaxID=97485 RepID=A0AB34JVM0_PRYPA